MMRRKGGGFFQGWLPWLLFLTAISALVIANAVKNVSQIETNDNFEGTDYSADPTSSIIYSQAQPRVTEDQIVAYVRDNGGDRLKNSGHLFYKYGVKYNTDPAFGVAVTLTETTLGKFTCHDVSQSCNNFYCIEKSDKDIQDVCGRWQKYDDIDEGVEAFFRLIEYYKKRGQDTISEIGCVPGSGFVAGKDYCYCLKEDPPSEYEHCQVWAGGSGSVPALVSEIRNYNILSSVTLPSQG